MKRYYSATQKEVDELFGRFAYFKEMALINRDAGDTETSREYYFKAKGMEEALKILGLLRSQPRCDTIE